MCSIIHALLPIMVAQQTQKTASVNSELEASILRITDISRRQYTRKPTKVVVDICTCCAKTQKSRKFYWDFFRGRDFFSCNCLARLCARRESLEYLGYMLGKASSASSGVTSYSSGIGSKPSFWAV